MIAEVEEGGRASRGGAPGSVAGGLLAVLLVAGTPGCSTGPEPVAAHVARAGRVERYLAETPERPLLVVDIDDTLVEGGACPTLHALAPLGAGPEPLPGAPEALRRLTEDWNVVLLTARDDIAAHGTLRWLERQGFPELPVVFASRIIPAAVAQRAYKSAAVAGLLERGLLPGSGVGDTTSDAAAYLENGLEAVLVCDGLHDADLERALGERADPVWPHVAPMRPRLALVTTRPAAAWRRVEAFLRARVSGLGADAPRRDPDESPAGERTGRSAARGLRKPRS